MKAFLFHGTGGHSKENWLPWMSKKLQELGYETIVPDFPDADSPQPEKWYPVIDALVGDVDEDSIVIGHSLGAAIALRFLERIDMTIHVLALVGVTLGIPPIKFIEGDSPFLEGGFDWATIKSRTRHSIVFHSDDDPFVDMANGREAAAQLSVDMTFIPNAGHFNASAGYTEFPELLEALKPHL